MNQMPPAVSPATLMRGMRIIHAALVIGLVLVGAVFFLVTRTNPSFGAGVGSEFGYGAAGLALINVTVALAYLWPRMPQRPAGQSPEDYWVSLDVRSRAIRVWALVESAGLASWVGYLLTRSAVPVTTALVAIVALTAVRPGQPEGV